MPKSKMIFDEIGTVSEAAQAVPEPKPSYTPPKSEEPVSDDAED